MSIELVMSSNHLILCRPLLLLPSIFSSIGVFSNESVLCIRWQSIGVLALASVLPMNIQDWFPLRLTGLISLLSKRLSRVFSSIMIWKYQFFSNLRYGDDTTLMAKSKELKNLSMRVKEESEKGGLKLNIKKCKITAFGSITWWHIEGVIGWRWLKSTNLQL